MKKLTVLFLGLLAAATLSAAPFARWFDFPGAGGKTYPIYGEGDEFTAWFEAEDGHAVGFNDAAKAYEYLKPQADGSLIGTGILVGDEAGHEAELAAIPLHARDASKAHEEEVRARVEEDDAALQKTERWNLLKGVTKTTTGGKIPLTSAPSSPTVGNFTGCMLLVEFSDVKWPSTITKANMDTYANDENGAKLWNNTSSIWQFYHDVSCGKVSYKNVVIGPVTVPHPRSYYDDTDKKSGDCARLLIGDALEVLSKSASSVREGLSSVTKRDGRCIVLNVFFAGNEASVWSKGLWACQWTLASPISVDGVPFYTFQISPITSSPISYHFAHENGHALCGFPDLYNAGGAHNHCLMGNTCLMAGRPNDRDPQAPSAYLRAAAGWVEPKTLPNNTYVTLTRDYGDVYKYKNPNNENEYYLIENRGQRHDQDKTRHDGSISGSGIVIYHCMANGNNKSIDWNTAFSAETSNVKYRCKCEATLEQADGQYHHERNQWIADANDFWSAGNTAADYPGEFSDLTVPTARWADGTPSGLVLSEFSANGDTMTFAVGTPVIEGAPTISGTITAGGYVGTGKLTISNFGTGASSADVFVDIYGEATKKTLVGSVNLATGVTSTSQKTYTFPLVNGLASQYLRFRVVNNQGKAAYGTLTEAANGKAGDSSGGWGTDGGNEFGKAVDAPSLTINYTQNGAEWQKDTSATDYMTASSCLKFYGAATATSAKTATLTATVAGPATFKFYASSKLSMNTDTGKPQCSVVFTAKNAGGSTISTSTIPCTSTTKTAYQVYSVNLPSGNNTLTWVGSWIDPVSGTYNVGNVYIDKFLLEKNVAATIPIAKITTSSLQPDRATVSAQVTDKAGESSVNVTSIVVSQNSDYSSPVHTGAPGLVTGLEPLTRYYVKVTLTGDSGTTYPAIGSFVTPDWTKPTGSVTVSSVQHYSATVDVSVTNPGSENAANIVKTVTVARDAAYIEVIKSGASVPCEITGLDAGTTYYVRGILTGPLTGDTYVESTFTTLSASYPLIGSVVSSDVGTDRIAVNVTVSGFGDGSSGGTVLVEAVSGDTVAASANGTASGVYELTGLDRDTSYTIRVTVTGSNGLSTTDESLVVKTLNVPVILADPKSSIGEEGASATMSARVAFRESTVNDSNVKLYLTQAGGSETLAKTWNSYAQGDVLSFSADTEPNVDYTYRFVATTTWNSKNWTSEVAGEFRTEYYVTNDWLTVDFESYQVNSALPDSDASGSWTKNVGGVYESSSSVANFASEFGKGKGLDQSGESTYAKYTATAARPDGIRCLFDADMYFTVCKVPPESLTDQVLATATTAIFLYSGDEANNFRVYTADGWKDVFAEGFEPANKTFHHVTIDVDYDASPARIRFTVDGHLLADANGVKWFNRANSSSTAKLTAVSVYGNTKLDGFSAKMLEYANDVCAHANKTETSAAVAATCTVAGHTAAYRCPDCGRVWEAETIPVLGHDWGEWTTKKAATTTEAGISRRECQRSGCNAYEEQEIPKLANVIALRNIAVVTAVGIAPELPAKVAGLKADGTVGGEYDVSWSPASVPDSPGITMVSGTAQVNGTPMTVTASVRAAAAAGGDLVNLSPLASIATVTAASKYTKAEELLKSDTPLADNQWADYLVNVNNSSNPNTTQLALEWDSPVMVSEVAVYFVNNHSNYQPPDNVKFYNDSDETPTEIAFTAGDIVDSGTIYAHITYSFTSPHALSKLRFYATPIDPNNGSRALFTRRMWVYGPDASAGGSVDPTTTDTLTALAVDGTPIAGFAPTTYSYSVDNGTAISSAVNADDNVGITILQKSVTGSDNAYVVTLAENGTATQKYTVAMSTVTVCAHENTSLTGVIAATCTTAGYSGDTVCDDCHETIQTGSVIPALGHLWGEWVTTKDPTTTEAGSKRRECQREGCDAEEVEEIPMLEGVTLTLDPKGGTVASTTVDLPAQSLPTPTRDGYHFVGWFKDEIDASAPYVRGKYLCGEPLTAATADDKDKILYAKWVKNDVYNHFQGKKAVFVGDSVSTLHGYAAVNRQVYTSNIFYTEAKAAEQGITATNTWWGQLVQALDMSLLSVNAVAGSPVTDSEPSITYDVRAMSSTARIDDLDVNGTPDVIFIFGGINDFNGNTKAPIDDYDPNASYLTDELDLTSDYFPTFAEGYATMLRRMRHYYPDAEIVAIGPYIAASDRDAYKPVFVKGNTTISNLCARFNVPYLNLMNTQLPYWANGVKLLCDSYHPNQAGFTEFANYVLENYVPACAHEHKTALTGVVTATCTTDGYSGDCTCEDCGETILGHVITKLGHDWSDWVTTKDPSTTETGLRERNCQRVGCGAHEEEVIPMIVDIVALRNIAVVTAVGTAPTLPAKVAGLKADGTVGGEYEVSWSLASVPDSPGITTVSGTATVNGAPMTVTASIRAAVAGGNLANVSPSSTLTSTDPQGAYLSEVVSADEPDPSVFKWMTVLRTNASDMTNTLTWDAPKTISKVRIAYSGHQNHSRPATVDFNTGAVNIPMQETSRETVGAHLWVEYTFSQPTAVTTLLCHFTRGSEVNSILVERIWAYEVQSGGSVEPTTTDTLTALAVDGNAVAGFAATTYGYTVTNGKTVSSAVNADDNVGITILQKSVTGSDNAYVVTLAENGTATQKYTVAMPAGEEPPPEDDDVFVNPYADIVVSEAVSNQVKTLTWCSLGTSVTDFNDNPIEGRTQGYQFYTMDKLGWSHDKLLNIGHSGSIVGVANDFPKTTPYDIYTIEFGINDWGTGHPVGTISDYRNYLYNDKAVRWHLFASCYRNVIETIRAANPNAVIVLTTPRKGYGFNGTFPDDCADLTLASKVGNYYSPDAGAQVDGEQTYLEDYAKLIRQIAEEEDLVLCDWYAYAADQDNLAKRSVDVAVHPNDRGYEMMAQMLAPKILQAVAAHVVNPPVTGESLTLNANGGTVSSTTVDLPAQSLPTPTRDGYHFVGWFEDKTLTSYDFTPGGSYVPGTFLYGTPVTAPSADYADKTLYAKWVKTSVYEHFHGKKVTVYGDSVSTLLGFVPSAESEMFNGGVFYGQSYVDMGINEHTQWWGQLVDALGMQLLEINAIGGSSVGAYAYEYGLERKAMMNYTRMRLLDDAGTPDVIIVAAGINDYNDNTTGFNANADYLTNELDRVTSICPDFAKAYALMIRRLQDLYPTTEIVALSSFDVGAATATETGNDCIRKTCALYNVVNIDMRDAFTLNDGSGVNYRQHGIHPGISGFAAIANCFLESYAPIANPVVVPDCGHTWGFGVLTTPATATASGVRTYTCRYCSATRTEEVPYVALSEGTEADITSQATVKGVYLLPDDRQVAANTVDKQATPLASYNGYLESPSNLVDGNVETVYRDWIMNDRYIAFTFEQPMVVTSVKLVGVRNMYPNRIQIVDPNNRLLGKTEGGIPWNSAAGEHQCTITTTERVATSELRLAVDFEYVGKEFQLKEVEIFGYAAGTEPPIDPPDDPVETEIVALRNVAVVTAVGIAPTLPEKVAGLKADGTVSGEYDVVWETATAPAAVGITTVTGTAQVNGTPMTVTASVRAANASSGDAELVNVSPSATPTSNDPSAKTHSVPSLVSADSPGDSVVWVTANNGSNLDLINTLTWDSPVTISKVRVCYSGSHKPPSSYAFSSDSSGTPEITFTAGQVETVGNHRWIEFTFGQPTTLSTLRCFFGNPPGWLIVERIWAYEVKGSAGGTVEPLTTDTLTALQVDGKDVADFASTTYGYTVKGGKTITSATSTDNMGITILPKHDGSAYVVTLAEDGTSTKTYTVSMPPSSVKRGFMIIVTGGSSVVNTPEAWRVQILDPTHIVVQYDGYYSFDKEYKRSGDSAAAASAMAESYAQLNGCAFSINGTDVQQIGHSISPRGQLAYADANGHNELFGGTNNSQWMIRPVHHLYVRLASPLIENMSNKVVLPDGKELKFVYNAKTVSPLFKVNQVGYAASAAEKYVYLGGWMGTAGTFPLNDSYSYDVVNASSGAVALSGTFTKRVNDSAVNGVNLTGEKTLEADISALTTAGTYFVRVNGLGRSMDFRVSDDAAVDQFAVHMLGLYQQRCGCAKEEPYTHWTDTCCHQKVYRGVHPSNDDEYKKCFGGTAQSAFAIIKANADDCKEELTLPGGWHDAADYDRRPYHLQVVVDLANAYLMKPANFTDGQLAVPEKNNGIPDILDEADWGLKFYLAAQQDDGGVGGWAETVTHPDYSNKKMPSGDTDIFHYYLGRATHRSTLKYCGTAANLARALYAVGTSQATARADVYKASAVAAWSYVMRTDNWQSNVEMKGPNGKVYYTEPTWYDPYEYTKAAVNLGVITGNQDYFGHLSDTISYRSGGKDEYNYGDKNNTVYGIFEDGWGCATKDESYGRTGFILSELGLSCAADNIDAYKRIKNKWVARVTANAEDIISLMTSAMAYRTAAPYGVSKMAWGACVPLRNAEWLCAAHFFTGDAKYLKAAQLASDYHSGCNPCGATWTSGLGKIYPVAFLSLHSFADSIAEYVPGITPYHNTGSDFGCLFNTATTGRYTTYQAETAAKPWWRRFEVGENMSIGISEYTVTETIGPCAAASGYLINAGHTTANLNWRQPAAKLSDLPGYWALP